MPGNPRTNGYRETEIFFIRKITSTLFFFLQELPSIKRQRISLEDIEKLFASCSLNDVEVEECGEEDGKCECLVEHCGGKVEECEDGEGESEKKIECEDRVGECEDRVGECEDRVGECEDRVGECEDRVGECEDRVGECEDRVEECEDRVDECEDRVGECERILVQKIREENEQVSGFLINKYEIHTEKWPREEEGRKVVNWTKEQFKEHMNNEIKDKADEKVVEEKKDKMNSDRENSMYDTKSWSLVQCRSVQEDKKYRNCYSESGVNLEEGNERRGEGKDEEDKRGEKRMARGDVSASYTLSVKRRKGGEEKRSDMEGSNIESDGSGRKSDDITKLWMAEGGKSEGCESTGENSEGTASPVEQMGVKREGEVAPFTSHKRQKKIKRGLRLCSNITCYIEQTLYNC